MNRWEYLSTPLFKSRYALAAHFIPSNISVVVEVGGYKNCIGDYVKNPIVFAVDPLLEIMTPNVHQYLMDVADFPMPLVQDSVFALVMMGFDITKRRDMLKVQQLIHKASFVIIEYAREHVPNQLQVVAALDSVMEKRTVIQLDLWSELPMPGGYTPFYKREMIIIDRRPS